MVRWWTQVAAVSWKACTPLSYLLTFPAPVLLFQTVFSCTTEASIINSCEPCGSAASSISLMREKGLVTSLRSWRVQLPRWNSSLLFITPTDWIKLNTWHIPSTVNKSQKWLMLCSVNVFLMSKSSRPKCWTHWTLCISCDCLTSLQKSSCFSPANYNIFNTFNMNLGLISMCFLHEPYLCGYM